MLLQVEVPAESLPANVAVEGFHRKVRVHVETQVRHLFQDLCYLIKRKFKQCLFLSLITFLCFISKSLTAQLNKSYQYIFKYNICNLFTLQRNNVQ